MQHVELVQRHPVDELLDVLRRLEVPRGIEHQAAPCEARRIGDPQRGNIHGQPLHGIRRDELPQRHRTVEESRGGARRDGDAFGRDRPANILPRHDSLHWLTSTKAMLPDSGESSRGARNARSGRCCLMSSTKYWAAPLSALATRVEDVGSRGDAESADGASAVERCGYQAQVWRVELHGLRRRGGRIGRAAGCRQRKHHAQRDVCNVVLFIVCSPPEADRGRKN